MSFESPLRGVESTLPPPLAKSAAETLPLRIEVNPAAGGERDRISVTLGALARGEVARRKQGGAMAVQRTAVWLTPERDQPIRLPERPGTLVYGSLPAFDLDRWLALLARLGEGESQPVSLELKFGALDAFGRRFNNVALRASGEAGGWSANVSADELAGDVSYRGGEGGRLVARLEPLQHSRRHAGRRRPSGARRRGRASCRRSTSSPRSSPSAASRSAASSWSRAAPATTGASRSDAWRTPTLRSAAAACGARRPSRTAVRVRRSNAGDAGSFLARVGYPGLVNGGRARMHGIARLAGRPGDARLSVARRRAAAARRGRPVPRDRARASAS